MIIVFFFFNRTSHVDKMLSTQTHDTNTQKTSFCFPWVVVDKLLIKCAPCKKLLKMWFDIRVFIISYFFSNIIVILLGMSIMTIMCSKVRFEPSSSQPHLTKIQNLLPPIHPFIQKQKLLLQNIWTLNIHVFWNSWIITILHIC
jgi:hypothetical protein